MKKIWLLLLSGFLMAGCATFPEREATTANFERILSSMVGLPEARLIARWGVPRSSYPLSNGAKIIQYEISATAPLGGSETYYTPQTTYHSGSVSTYGRRGYSGYGSYSGTSTTYVPQTTSVYNVTYFCIWRFTISQDGIAKYWSYEGNYCRANPPD